MSPSGASRRPGKAVARARHRVRAVIESMTGARFVHARFPSPAKLCGYTGLCPRVYQSGKSDRRGPISKQGSRYLRWALFEAALHACNHPLQRALPAHHNRLDKQRDPNVAQIDLSGTTQAPARGDAHIPASRVWAGLRSREQSREHPGTMSTVDRLDNASEPDDFQQAAGESPKKRRNPWIWVSVALAVVAVGLLVWGLRTKSDLDDANKQVDQLQTQLGVGAVAGSTAAASYRSAYEDLQKQVGSTSADLASTEDDLQQAQDAAANADKEAAAAKKEAEQAKNQTDMANAEVKQAQAQADAAEAKAKVTTDCAQAYLGSVAKLFEGDNPSSQEAAVKEDLKSVSADCKKALAGT